MKLISILSCVVLLGVTGCLQSENLTLFDGNSTHSRTERGDIHVEITFRPKSTAAQPLPSLDTLLARARDEIPLYTNDSSGWEFTTLRAYRSDKNETAYQVEFWKEWDRWILVVLAPDGTPLGRPPAR